MKTREIAVSLTVHIMVPAPETMRHLDGLAESDVLRYVSDGIAKDAGQKVRWGLRTAGFSDMVEGAGFKLTRC